MIKIIKNAPENIAAFAASGEVSAQDFEIVYEEVRKKVRQEGELNYLLKLDTDVKNFTAGAWIQDLLLGIKNLTKWNRCAIVSDDRAVKIVTDISNKFTIGEFKVFAHSDLDRAMNWVSTGKSKVSENNKSHIGSALLAGLGGAVALNILHETVRKNFDNVPEVNKLGEEALDKSLEKADIHLNEDQLYGATLAGDIVSNALYYSALATNKAGIISGIVGGIGAVELPKYLGLNDKPVAETTQKKIITVAYYAFGAAVTGLIYNKLKKK